MTTIQNIFISVSDLQKNTKFCIGNINTVGKKVILSNNKPQAILLSLVEFEKLSKGKFDILETEVFEDEIKAINRYEKEKIEGKLDIVPFDA